MGMISLKEHKFAILTNVDTRWIATASLWLSSATTAPAAATAKTEKNCIKFDLLNDKFTSQYTVYANIETES